MPTASDIQRLFGRVAPRYDFLNHVLSGFLDMGWRRVLAHHVRQQHPRRLLDLATGSGDVAQALKKYGAYAETCVGADFCLPMLHVARQKEIHPLCVANGMRLPFKEGSFDAITISFGIRNLTDRPAGLREMSRVLKPGGRLYILEFSRPWRILRPVYFFYLHHVMPRLVRFFLPDAEDYVYLCDSIEAFPPQETLAAMIRDNGFAGVRYHNLTGGIVALHIATKAG